MIQRCNASLGTSPDPAEHKPCGRKATHVAIDEHSDVYHFCARCMAQFRECMDVVQRLPRPPGEEGEG